MWHHAEYKVVLSVIFLELHQCLCKWRSLEKCPEKHSLEHHEDGPTVKQTGICAGGALPAGGPPEGARRPLPQGMCMILLAVLSCAILHEGGGFGRQTYL